MDNHLTDNHLTMSRHLSGYYNQTGYVVSPKIDFLFCGYCYNNIKWFWYESLNDVGLIVGPILVHFSVCTKLLITIQLEKGFQ